MIADTLRKNMISIAAAYSKATGKTISQVSKKFYGNQDFLDRLKAQTATVSIDKYDELYKSFAAHWPENASWPRLDSLIFSRRR